MQERLTINSTEIARLLGTVGSPLIVISELIKNGIDANATKIEVIYDCTQCVVKVIDNGIGISIEEIKNLAKPGYSTKKINGNVRNQQGFFFTGNKGLGILSCFSLCESIIIDTIFEEKHKCHAVLSKNGILDYQLSENEDVCKTGTIITLQSIRPSDMSFLNTSSELQKIRHLSTYLYKKDELPFPTITLKIDDEEPKSVYLDTEFKNMLYDVEFNYNKALKKLFFSCRAGDGKDINFEQIEVVSFDLQNLEKVALEHYRIKKTIKTRTNDNADYQSYTELDDVPSFEGRILVYDNQKAGATLKQYGAGVNLYVNQFALYNYLSSDNDWLGLADFSQRKKVTNLRPHNVFGYVNFNEFNENIEVLRISNERADFIQDQVFKKLMYLLKGVIMFFVFNIDVAEKNPKYKVPIEKSDTNFSAAGEGNTEKNSTYNAKTEDTAQDPTENIAEPSEFSVPQKKEKSSEANIGNDALDHQADTANTYVPGDNYKPKKRFVSGLSFTVEEGKVIEKLKNRDSLSNKIYHLIYEITHLNIQSFYCSTSGVYRGLLECATRYAAQKHPDKIKFTEECLRDNIISVLNYYGNQGTMDKQIKLWRETVNKRYLIDTLNQYMHNETEVDIDFIEQTWKTMKSYIIRCISE